MDLVVEDGSRVEVAYFLMDEANVRRAVRLSWMGFDSDEAAPAPDAFTKVFGADGPGIYVYTRETARPGRHFHARMFGSPAIGVREDPATGSAVASFTGVLMQCEPLGDGEHSFVIEQGYEMGRPSEIDLQIVIREGALASGEIGGGAVVVSEGEIEA